MRRNNRVPAMAGRTRFERICAILGGTEGPDFRSGQDRHDLVPALEIADIELTPQKVHKAATKVGLIVLMASSPMVVIFLLSSSITLAAVIAILAVTGSLASSTIMNGYPKVLAERRAQALLRLSPEAVNLMIMSLRHSPSVSRAIEFASHRPGEFSLELRRCMWDVMIGNQSSIEDSLLAFGSRMERFGPELKASLTALVTASREATEAGVRRALDRASHAIVAGAKRRIEEYAMSLSTPSMLLFGLGILLPLMVGSFLPMLAWDFWSSNTDIELNDGGRSGGGMLETAIVMNVLFPAIAVFIALGAASRHPIASRSREEQRKAPLRWFRVVPICVVLSGIGMYSSWVLLDGLIEGVGLLMASVAPWALMMSHIGRRSARTGRACEGDEDVLFRVGARMADGGNFETSLALASSERNDDLSLAIRRLSAEHIILGLDFEDAAERVRHQTGSSNLVDGLVVVHDASTKDEDTAGILAMDLAAYLRDLQELAAMLRTRLRPTVSMMKATSHFLGPFVLGITFALYVSLTSVAGGDSGERTATGFLLILGLFLAESNAVVMYFVGRIGGEADGGILAQLGNCLLVSESIFAVTALMAS